MVGHGIEGGDEHRHVPQGVEEFAVADSRDLAHECCAEYLRSAFFWRQVATGGGSHCCACMSSASMVAQRISGSASAGFVRKVRLRSQLVCAGYPRLGMQLFTRMRAILLQEIQHFVEMVGSSVSGGLQDSDTHIIKEEAAAASLVIVKCMETESMADASTMVAESDSVVEVEQEPDPSSADNLVYKYTQEWTKYDKGKSKPDRSSSPKFGKCIALRNLKGRCGPRRRFPERTRCSRPSCPSRMAKKRNGAYNIGRSGGGGTGLWRPSLPGVSCCSERSSGSMGLLPRSMSDLRPRQFAY